MYNLTTLDTPRSLYVQHPILSPNLDSPFIPNQTTYKFQTCKWLIENTKVLNTSKVLTIPSLSSTVIVRKLWTHIFASPQRHILTSYSTGACRYRPWKEPQLSAPLSLADSVDVACITCLGNWGYSGANLLISGNCCSV